MSSPTVSTTMASSTYAHSRQHQVPRQLSSPASYAMPIKCEPISPTAVSYPLPITSTTNTFSSYHLYTNGAIDHSPQLPPTPQSPTSTSIVPIQSPTQSIAFAISSNTPTITSSNSNSCYETMSSASSPCPSVASESSQVRQTTSLRKKESSASKRVNSSGAGARVGASKKGASTDSMSKLLKMSGTSRSSSQNKKRNERERKRVFNVNIGYKTLQERIPKCSKKMSKVETLRTAINYIRQLQQVLYEAGGPAPSESILSNDFYPDTDSQASNDLDFLGLEQLLG